MQDLNKKTDFFQEDKYTIVTLANEDNFGQSIFSKTLSSSLFHLMNKRIVLKK